MANAEVGKYLNNNFVASYQKVGTFTINGAKKQGGNVASYFCTPDGRVLHAVAGPVKAEVLLREARWVVESEKLADLDGIKGETRRRAFWRKVHSERLQQEHQVDSARLARATRRLKLNKAGLVHLLLATAPRPRLDQVYKLVFEKILKEKVSTAPVVQIGG
ncbi:MAG TPA: hypothetical protein VMG10_14480 [Gemmataceae bacterium]|nr:hypothetical protein [Gemmataceae bacterium]